MSRLRQEIEDQTIDEDGISEDYLEQLFDRTNRLDVLVYSGRDSHDISWLLQGIRHISGIRNWAPAQRARLVVEQIDKKGISGFKAAGQTFGLSGQAVGRLYRAYKVLDQMRQDDEFSAKAKNDYFTLFEEAIRNKSVKEWLGWSNESMSFERDDNLKQFYSWISVDEEHNNVRRIHDPRQIKELGYLISGDHKTLLSQIDQCEISIGEAYGKVLGLQASTDWKDQIDQARNLIADLPQEPMFEETEDFLEALNRIEEQISQRKSAISGLVGSKL